MDIFSNYFIAEFGILLLLIIKPKGRMKLMYTSLVIQCVMSIRRTHVTHENQILLCPKKNHRCYSYISKSHHKLSMQHTSKSSVRVKKKFLWIFNQNRRIFFEISYRYFEGIFQK